MESSLVFNTSTGDFEIASASYGDPLDKTQETPPLTLEQVAAAMPDEIVKAESGSGAWGASTFHNLTDGARASGNVHSAHSLLGAADLDWDPMFAPLYTGSASGAYAHAGAGQQIPSDVGRAVVRSDSGKPIGIVGARYSLIPHRKLADLADAIVGASDATLRFGNAGHKSNGARPFIQLKSAPHKIGRDVRGADVEVSDVITLLTSHDGTLNAMACYGANVIVCDNTYAHALSCAKARAAAFKHLASGSKLIDEAIRVARETAAHGQTFTDRALTLIARPMTDENMRQLASALVTGDSTRAENERRKLMDAWTSSPGAAPGSAWGAAQAVTWWTTHEIGARGDTDRAFGLETGEGRGADVQASAWWYLAEAEGQKALQTVKLLRC